MATDRSRALAMRATLARIAIGLLLLELGVGTLIAVYGTAALSAGSVNIVAAQFFGVLFVLMMIPTFLLSIIPIVMWVWLAHANLRASGINGLNYSPAWSAGSFFVPFANLIVPFGAMRELHNRSHGEGAEQAEAAVGDVTSWWACHVAAVFLWSFIFCVSAVNRLTYFKIVTPPLANVGLLILALLLLAGSAFYLFQTIGAITRAQRSMLYFNAAEVFA